MPVLKSIISSVWRVQLRPSLAVLLGVSVLVGLYEVTGRHTGVVAFLLLMHRPEKWIAVFGKADANTKG